MYRQAFPLPGLVARVAGVYAPAFVERGGHISATVFGTGIVCRRSLCSGLR